MIKGVLAKVLGAYQLLLERVIPTPLLFRSASNICYLWIKGRVRID